MFVNPGDTRVVQAGEGCGLSGCHSEHAEWTVRSGMSTGATVFAGAAFAAGLPNPRGDARHGGTVADDAFRSVDASTLAVSPLPGAATGLSQRDERAGGLTVGDPFGTSGDVGDNQLYSPARFFEWGTYLWPGPSDDLDPRSLAYDREAHMMGAPGAAALYTEYRQEETLGFLAQTGHWLALDVAAPALSDRHLPSDFDNALISGSRLETIYQAALSEACGDCHGGIAPRSARAGDLRGTGCSSCHLGRDLDGLAKNGDLQLAEYYPGPEAESYPPPGRLPHPAEHRIGTAAAGAPITDEVCATCHSGSNRTVLQYWGVRLDQNFDVHNGYQYPANPQAFVTAANDQRLYPDALKNNTFNGRYANQHLVVEDYDGDGRDDTPPDVHYEAGLGCVDCHGSRDMHGGTRAHGMTGAVDPSSGSIAARQGQSTQIRCESCHGDIGRYAATVACRNYQGEESDCAVDAAGNPLRHVNLDAEGRLFLTSRVTGNTHYVPQVKAVIDASSGVTDPRTSASPYSSRAAFAMGRLDGLAATGVGPVQTGATSSGTPGYQGDGFAHGDTMDCVSCHASWTNDCIGCHLYNEYNADPSNFQFSNITGQRIVVSEDQRRFTYQSPLFSYLRVGARGRVTSSGLAGATFFQYKDRNGEPTMDFNSDGASDVRFLFTDQRGNGANMARGNLFPGGTHASATPHSVRGRATASSEGPRYCSHCHLNEAMRSGANWSEYIDFYDRMSQLTSLMPQARAARFNGDQTAVATLVAQAGAFYDEAYALVRENNGAGDGVAVHFGLNAGNQNESPFWVHGTAGLGTTLFLFDEKGCPINATDGNPNRQGCDGISPADNLNNMYAGSFANVVDLDENYVYAYDLDRLVNDLGAENVGGGDHPVEASAETQVSALRDGAYTPVAEGPLGATLVRRLASPTDGIVLDAWLDADRGAQGNATGLITD